MLSEYVSVIACGLLMTCRLTCSLVVVSAEFPLYLVQVFNNAAVVMQQVVNIAIIVHSAVHVGFVGLRGFFLGWFCPLNAGSGPVCSVPVCFFMYLFLCKSICLMSSSISFSFGAIFGRKTVGHN